MQENHGSTGQASYLRVFWPTNKRKTNNLKSLDVWWFGGFQCQHFLRTRSVWDRNPWSHQYLKRFPSCKDSTNWSQPAWPGGISQKYLRFAGFSSIFWWLKRSPIMFHVLYLHVFQCWDASISFHHFRWGGYIFSMWVPCWKWTIDPPEPLTVRSCPNKRRWRSWRQSFFAGLFGGKLLPFFYRGIYIPFNLTWEP